MKKVLILGLFLATASLAQAQINLKSLEQEAETAESSATGAEVGTLLTGLESHIKPAAQTTDFTTTKKTSWLASAKKAVTAAEASSLLSQLVSGLKSTAFSSGWASIKDKWFASAKTTTTSSGLKTLASQLVSNLNTSSLTNGADSKTTLNSVIGALK